MQIKKTVLATLVAALAQMTTARPTPIRATTEVDAQPPVPSSSASTGAAANTTVSYIETRDEEDEPLCASPDPRPPRNTTLAEGITLFDLPPCYQNCFRMKDGKSSIHMGKDTLDAYCRTKVVMIDWWLEHSIRPCVKRECKGEIDPHNRAREWHKAVCGLYP